MNQIKTLHSSLPYFNSLLVQTKIAAASVSIITFSTAPSIPSLPLQCGPEANTVLLTLCCVCPGPRWAVRAGGVLGGSAPAYTASHQWKYIAALLKEVCPQCFVEGGDLSHRLFVGNKFLTANL